MTSRMTQRILRR